jgi:hypothetical protein
MKTRLLIFIGIIVSFGSVFTFVTADYFDKLSLDLFSNVPYQLQRVLNHCEEQKSGNDVFAVGLNYYNETHYIDNTTCEWQLLVNYPNSDSICIPGQHMENNEHRIRNDTHIYDNESCMWKEVEICTGYCGEENEN